MNNCARPDHSAAGFMFQGPRMKQKFWGVVIDLANAMLRKAGAK